MIGCGWRGCGRALPLLACIACAAVHAQGWGGSIGISSDDVYRGVTQSDNQPAGQADVHYTGGSGGGGWFAGVSASSSRRDPGQSTTAEIDPYLGYQWPLARDWSARLDAVHHGYPWNTAGGHYDYDELSATLAYADRVFASLSFSPDTSVAAVYQSVSGRTALAYDLVLRQPLPHGFSLNAGVGYYDLRWAVNTGYLYWNGGLAYQLGPVQLDLSYIGTDGTARRLFYGDLAVNRLVGGARWQF